MMSTKTILRVVLGHCAQRCKPAVSNLSLPQWRREHYVDKELQQIDLTNPINRFRLMLVNNLIQLPVCLTITLWSTHSLNIQQES